MHAIKWFNDIGMADRPQVGGKGGSLGELTQAGIAVPPGFVVPVATFEQFLSEFDPDGECRDLTASFGPDDLAGLSIIAQEIRDRITQAQLPHSLETAIAAAYRTICGGESDAPVAVRSSATTEDGDDASFAGLQDTYLWLRGEAAVAEHVRRCWASMYNAESIAYRRRLDIPEDQVAMAVVVQRMVLSRCAGVMFTRSPTTGDRSKIVIEASWGFGSCLVGGEVTPDRFTVNKVTGEIGTQTISKKLVRHAVDPAGGVRAEEVPPELQSVSCLSQDDLMKLVAEAKRIEQHYGRPQDIEWAIDEDGELFVLQSRPETVWSSRERAPLATAKENPFDHIFSALSKRKA